MIARSPIDAEAAIERALAARDAGNIDQAIASINAALASHRANPRLWQTLGVLHRAGEDAAAAASAFRQAAQLAPRDLRASYGYAQASLEAGRPAVALFEHALTLAPADGGLLIGLSAALLAERRAGDAIIFLEALLARNPLWLDGHAALSRLLWMMGANERLGDSYRQALNTNPRAPALSLALIDVYLQAELYDDARRATAGAAAAGLDDPAFILRRAICASELELPAVADAIFATLGRTTDTAVAERWLRHLLRSDRADVAARDGEIALSQPDNVRIWPYLSLAWRLTGDTRWQWLEGDPALVSVVQLDGFDAIGKRLAARLRSLQVAVRDPIGQSVRGGTQTDGPLFAHEDQDIRALRDMVMNAVRGHVAAMGECDPRHPTRRHIDKRYRVAGSWSVRLTGAGHHSNHVHPQGWISSACYIALPSQDAMGPPPSGWLQLGVPPVELGLSLPAIRQIAPKPGQLVLFPSTMWHGTVPITAGERLSVAFDIAAVA